MYEKLQYQPNIWDKLRTNVINRLKKSHTLTFCMLFISLSNVVHRNVEQCHLTEQLWQPFLHELQLALLHDLLLGTFGDKVTQAAFIIYNVRARQLVVSLDGCIGVDLQHHGIFADAGNAVVVFLCSCEYLIAEAVGHLDVYRLIISECHTLFLCLLFTRSTIYC